MSVLSFTSCDVSNTVDSTDWQRSKSQSLSHLVGTIVEGSKTLPSAFLSLSVLMVDSDSMVL
jgi:hypothetical protein